ncbi:MAG: hypothetical protein GW839_14085 [Flavobacteriales bacterium]|nr:hypothetical protein [Flavobacteriales bacterium]NCP83936.1 hypothetical protein [Bacteroidota bacterium]NCT17232.1 hypothetical protein [Flavobacteriia bacterium]
MVSIAVGKPMAAKGGSVPFDWFSPKGQLKLNICAKKATLVSAHTGKQIYYNK